MIPPSSTVRLLRWCHNNRSSGHKPLTSAQVGKVPDEIHDDSVMQTGSSFCRVDMVEKDHHQATWSSLPPNVEVPDQHPRNYRWTQSRKVGRRTRKPQRPADSPVVCTACTGTKELSTDCPHYRGPCPAGVLWKTGTVAEHATTGPSYPPYPWKDATTTRTCDLYGEWT